MLGRVYLPQDDLDHYGVTLRLDASGRLVDDDGALAATGARRGGPRRAAGTTRACGCCRCSTGAAPPAVVRWRASTATCSDASRPTRPSRSTVGCR